MHVEKLLDLQGFRLSRLLFPFLKSLVSLLHKLLGEHEDREERFVGDIIIDLGIADSQLDFTFLLSIKHDEFEILEVDESKLLSLFQEVGADQGHAKAHHLNFEGFSLNLVYFSEVLIVLLAFQPLLFLLWYVSKHKYLGEPIGESVYE